MEDVEDHDDVGLAERGAAHVAMGEVRFPPQRRLRPRDVDRHEVDALECPRRRRRGPVGGPVARGVPRAGCGEERREDPLATADVEDSRLASQQSLLEEVAEDGVAAQLAAREVAGEPVPRRVAQRRIPDEGAEERGTHESTAWRRVTARSPRDCAASSRRGSASRITGRPSALRAALPS